jgi:hypothetical protein
VKSKKARLQFTCLEVENVCVDLFDKSIVMICVFCENFWIFPKVITKRFSVCVWQFETISLHELYGEFVLNG